MMSLQVRAFREHGHVSFLLLSLATACGLLYVMVGQILGYLSHTVFAPPIWVFASATIFLFAQMIITVWALVALQILPAIGRCLTPGWWWRWQSLTIGSSDCGNR
jgi:hypothetical protein